MIVCTMRRIKRIIIDIEYILAELTSHYLIPSSFFASPPPPPSPSNKGKSVDKKKDNEKSSSK